MKESPMRQKVEEVILASYQSLYRMAYIYVKNPDDAMDVVQESVVKAIRGAEQVKETQHIRTWLTRIVMNTALDLLRHQKREVTELMLPEQGVEDTYPDHDLLAALDQLDERERAVVMLRFFEDRKLREIAQILQEKENTVKTILYRSLKKLKVRLSEGEMIHAEQYFG